MVQHTHQLYPFSCVVILTCMLSLIRTQSGADDCYKNFTENSDIVFLVDRTGSLSDINYNRSLSFIRDLIRRTIFVGQTRSRLAIITLGSSEKLHFDAIREGSVAAECELTSTENGLLSKISLEPKGNSENGASLGGALDVAGRIFDVSGSSRWKILIVVTDGHEILPQLILKFDDLRIHNKAEVFIVGIGSYVNPGNLRRMADNSSCHYTNITEWENRLIDIPSKLDGFDTSQERTVNVEDTSLCGDGCLSCTCKEFQQKTFTCTMQGQSSEVTTPQPTREPPQPSVNTPCTPGGPEGRECPPVVPGSTPTTGDDDDEEESGLPLYTIMIVVFAVLNFGFFSMWCMFVWLWCCGFLDKQLGTAPAPDMRTMKRKPPDGGNGEDPMVDPSNKQDYPEQEKYGNAIVANVLDANKPITAKKPEDVSITVPPSSRRPPPPAPVSPGAFSNQSYIGSIDEVREYSQIDPNDEDSESEDEYVNVSDRIRNKYREVKSRMSGVFNPGNNTGRDYENENDINAMRKIYHEGRLQPTRKAPAPPSKKTQISRLLTNNQFLSALSSRLGGKTMEVSNREEMNRQNSQSSSHSYLDLS